MRRRKDALTLLTNVVQKYVRNVDFGRKGVIRNPFIAGFVSQPKKKLN